MRYSDSRATGAPSRVPCCWINEANEFQGIDFDAATNFCRPCGEKRLASLWIWHPKVAAWCDPRLSEASFVENDGPAFCEDCGIGLDVVLTVSGAQQEVEHWEMYGPPTSASDWYDIMLILDAMTESCVLWPRLAAVVEYAMRSARTAGVDVDPLAARMMGHIWTEWRDIR